MTQCIVYDNTTHESETLFGIAAAKRWMKERIRQGHAVEGSKYRIYSDGEVVNCGKINLTGNNRSFVANSRQTRSNY